MSTEVESRRRRVWAAELATECPACSAFVGEWCVDRFEAISGLIHTQREAAVAGKTVPKVVPHTDNDGQQPAGAWWNKGGNSGS